MNHFTPFLPILTPAHEIVTTRSGRDLEERFLDAMRMRVKTQRRAEAILLLTTGFAFALAFASQVPA